MAKVVKNNLGYLGVDFQYKLISAFMEDQGFFRDLEKIIDQNMFTESYLRTIVGVLKEYFDKHSYLPSYEMLEIKLNDISYTEDEQQFYKETIQTLKKQPSFERDEIEQLAEKFFIQQNWIRVSNEIKRIAGDGDISKYDELMDLVEKANSVGKRNLEFFNPYDDMEKNLTPSSTTFIPTGIEKLDNTLGGGLEKGKLGAIIAPSGVGKALADDEIVMTPNGPKMIKEIKVGDNVIGSNGKAITVTGVFPQGVRKIYEVKFSDGTSCRCDMEHLWNVKGAKDTDYKTMTPAEIVENGIKNGNKYNFMIPFCNEAVEFEHVDVKYNKNMVALILGNGVMYKIDENNDVQVSIETNISDVEGNIIPNEIMYNSKEIRFDFINILISKLGRINKNGSITIKCTCEKFAKEIQLLINSLGLYAKIENGKKYYKVTFFTESEMNENRYIIDVNYLNEQEAICIKVDAEDELFLTKDFIVTHNTSLTTGISAYAASYKCESNNFQGFKVLQIVFEDTKRDLSRKYYGRISQVETCDIDKNIETVRELLDNYPDKDAVINNIRCIRKTSGETKAKDIRSTIEQMILTGWKPDLVIVDYFECVEVEGRSGENEWKREAKTMRKFETMAQELDIAMWIPIQGGKESINSELITMDKASGAVQKIQIPQVVISISRPYDADGNTNKAVIALLKHRGGKLGSTMHVDFNNGTCTITSDNTISFDSALAFNEESVKYEKQKKQEMIHTLMNKK